MESMGVGWQTAVQMMLQRVEQLDDRVRQLERTLLMMQVGASAPVAAAAGSATEPEPEHKPEPDSEPEPEPEPQTKPEPTTSIAGPVATLFNRSRLRGSAM
jgi:outer membrane biosynthesis protein TonB